MKSGIGHHAWMSKRLKSLGVEQKMLVSNRAGSIVVAWLHAEAFEGRGQPLSRPVLAMCTAGGGRTWKAGDGYRMDDIWYPGKVGLATPSPALLGSTPDMAGVFISFDMSVVQPVQGARLNSNHLLNISTRLYDDALATSVMTALWREAEVHGTSSVFFQHGLSNILHRLSTLAGLQVKPDQDTLRLDRRSPMREVLDIIDSRLADNLRIIDLAIWAGVDTKTLTRMFKRETGMTPFLYLTTRRMARARSLLLSGMTVTETALAVGYANPAKFAAAFRRSTGGTPTEWAKSKRIYN